MGLANRANLLVISTYTHMFDFVGYIRQGQVKMAISQWVI